MFVCDYPTNGMARILATAQLGLAYSQTNLIGDYTFIQSMLTVIFLPFEKVNIY